MRPHVICHMISSVDGRLDLDRWTPPVAGTPDGLAFRVYEGIESRLGADAWMIGRNTMAELVTGPFANKEIVTEPLPRDTFIAYKGAGSLATVVDAHGKLEFSCNSVRTDRIVTVLGTQVSDAYLASLRMAGISYVFAGPDGNNLESALQSLRRDFGVEKLLLEGGGILNGTFLAAGLIDELSLLIYPGIDGLAGVPSIFEFHGTEQSHPAKGSVLRHFHTETLESGVVWLRYRIEAVQPTINIWPVSS
ncbi:RibD family protein [Paraburkholderia sp. BL17N1]|uniref:RibD family protein n=2 Tax=Paraburkholderia dipogonis TaxID=1211383 RepID=A0A4Y8MHX6_9BURK|nr:MULTISPECIES: RibD family protein [Paraburkholderia]RKR31263.1 5-amino-6-(5-phosphoribosylamino)uracil reductase [Paraburkholderia sp. BL17N1]TFE37047.1 RibD family protein [Paraburkholderia dipogonis]